MHAEISARRPHPPVPEYHGHLRGLLRLKDVTRLQVSQGHPQAEMILDDRTAGSRQDDRADAELRPTAAGLNGTASLRDRLLARRESLGEKQLVTAGTMANTDVIGYYQNETRACFAVLHYVNGSLLDKEYEILATADDPKGGRLVARQAVLSRPRRGAQGHSDAV